MADLPASSIPPPSQLAGTAAVPSTYAAANNFTPASTVPASNISGHDVVDMGWDVDPEEIGVLVDGISNEEIWMLVRRLNKMVFHSKHTERASPDGLDLACAPEQEYSPNKMRSQLERLYMGIIIGSLSFVKHISRLRSWNEKTRTGVFCAVYFVMWTVDYLMPAVLIFMIALVMSPEARALAFPPAPISMVDSLSGDLTKPNSGILGSKDSITGAPENLQGEAVENESSNFVTGLAGIGMNIMSSEDVHGEPNTEKNKFGGIMNSGPDEIAQMVATGKDKAEGIDRPSIDKSKGPMVTIMWSYVRSGMIGMSNASDIWEKLANSLNPRPPYTTSSHRLRLVKVLLPMTILSLFATRDMIISCTTFSLGVCLFGRPLLQALQSWLSVKHPAWRQSLSIESTLLHGVPNNAQLALALLRHGEKQKTPLPPPPSRTAEAAPKVPLPLTGDVIAAAGNDAPLGASPRELVDAAAPDHEKLDEAGGNDAEVSKDNSREPHKILRLMKGAAKLGVRGTVALDKARAKAGHAGAKNRVGVVPYEHHKPIIGPIDFDAYYEGQEGFISVDSSAVVPILAFASAKRKEVPIWSVPISDITALRKHSGYGFKAKLTAGWALDKQLSDGLGISDKAGNEWVITAIPKRDALFNRLIAIGEQKWELW